MYSERLNKLINQVCHAWEEQAAEHEGKMRALANSIVAEHEAERFNTQKAFKSALASKNNEINALLSECKKLKALLTHIHGENKELQKKLTIANRTIESLRQGLGYDENGLPTSSKQSFGGIGGLGVGDDSTAFTSEDSLSVGGDYYGGLDDLSGPHGNAWNQPPSRQQPQSHLFPPRGRNSPDSEMYGYNSGGGGLGGPVGGGGYYPGDEPPMRGGPPSSSSGGIGGLFTSSSSSSSSSAPNNQHFSSRPAQSHGLVYGGRFVLEGAGEDPPGLYPRDDYPVDRSGSYDLNRVDREGDEYHQPPPFLEEPSPSSSSHGPPHSHPHNHSQAQSAGLSKRLSPSAPSFMPGTTSISKNTGSQLGALGGSPVARSNSNSASLNTTIIESNQNNTSAPPPPGFETFIAPSRDPFYEDGQQTISNSNDTPASLLQQQQQQQQTSQQLPPPQQPQQQQPPPLQPSQSSQPSLTSLSSSSSLTNNTFQDADQSFNSNNINNDEDNLDEQISSTSPYQINELTTTTNEELINQLRLQSKSSKLDAKPVVSSSSISASNPFLPSNTQEFN